MNTRSCFAVVNQLIRDTFRQARASGIFWMMLAVTGICVALCASISVSGDVVLHGQDEPALFLPQPSPRTVVPSVVLVFGSASPFDAAARSMTSGKVWFSMQSNPELAQREGVDTISGQMTLAFGAVSIPVGRDRVTAVHYVELLLGLGVADTLGLLLALVWTAGFLPTFLEPSAAAVLLAKPVPRWQLLLGKYVGVLTFVAFQAVLFVVLTWLALGIRTGVWDLAYGWCIPLILLHFAIFYSFSVLIAVASHSTVASVFGSALFWLLAWGINYGRVMALGVPESSSLPAVTRGLAETAYWISPKPIDGGLILFNALGAQHHFETPLAFQLLQGGHAFSPVLSILSSLAITGVVLALSIYEFSATDY